MQNTGRHTLSLLALTISLIPALVSGQTFSTESSGTLDPSFGIGGMVTTDFGGTSAAVRAVAVQPDGKILAAGSAYIDGVSDFALARYNRDGTLDASFGTGGTVTTPFDFPGNFDQVAAVVLQPDGKIVLAGSTVNVFANFALARFNSDGTLDASFGTGGIVTTNFGQVSAQAFSVAVQPDGKIVAAGYGNIDGGEDFALARYNSNGTLDATFGTGGKVSTAFAGPPGQGFSYALAYSVALQRDGKIVAAGEAFISGGRDFALARYNTNGTLDATFGTGGMATTDFVSPNDLASSIAVQPDGRIVAAGAAGPFLNRRFDFALARYNSNGTLDASFGTGGKAAKTDFAGFDDVPSSIALQGDGKIVVVGRTSVGDNFDFALARYNSNGTLDTSFGTSGRVTTDFAGSTQVPTSVALQADGNIVVAGVADINGQHDFALARYVGSAVTPAPDIDTAPASLAFGNVTQGSFKDIAVTVRNTGNATLSVTSTTLVGPAAAEYSIVAGGGAFSLAPGATRQVTVRLTATSLGSKVATLSFASNDTDENPKNVPLSATAVAPSDLLVSALTGPATAGAGFVVTLNDTTGNIGVGPAAGTSTRYYLSSDAAIGAGDVLLGGRSLAGLAPGASSAAATNVTIPAATANGSYFIVARADDLNQAFESNGGNNTRAITIRIGPDLRVSSLTAPAYGAAGRSISISDTTANLSASSPAAASTTRFYLSTNATLDAADVALGSRAVPALASGASHAGATLVTIPAATATGAYYILAEADGAHVLAEKNEANNVSSRVLRVGPDLVATVRGIAGTPTAGATISVQDLTSDPSAVAAPQSTTGYYLSTDNRLDAADVRIGGRAIPALAAGGSSLASGQAVVPAGTVPGAYFILAVADYPKVIVESNEGNNVNAFPITVIP
jgi:uncharacterized delta-60 repeat protein